MKILIVDDHELIRAGLRSVLSHYTDHDLVDAGTGDRAIALVRTLPDLVLVLLDLQLPDRSGLEVLDEIGSERPDLPVLVLSGQHDPDTVQRCLDAGAMGFVPKASVSRELVVAFDCVLRGEVYLPLELPRLPARPPDLVQSAPAQPRSGADGTQFDLTERQLEVLRLMAAGLSNKIICRELSLSIPTVKGHVTAILRALHVSSRTQAVLAASRHGLVSTD